MKKVLKIGVWIFTLLVLFVVFANWIIIKQTEDSILPGLSGLDGKKVALVFGTSKSTRSGSENLFFRDRIQAAAELYKTGKVKHIIVSGDNRTIYYNEPRDMLKALEIEGIPESAVTLDYAGLRTFDTVVRCKLIFGQTDVILVTQGFHAYRAQFIAQKIGMNSQVYAADFDSYTYQGLKIREFFARAQAVADLYFLNRSPKYLGEPIKLDIQ